MTRKMYSVSAAAGLLICLALNLYNRFVLVPRSMATFEIHPLSVICLFVTSPLSWVFIGMLLVALIFREYRNSSGHKWDVILLLIGVLLLVGFWVLAVLLYAGVSLTHTHLVLAWLTSNPMVFLISGIFIGMKLWNASR